MPVPSSPSHAGRAARLRRGWPLPLLAAAVLLAPVPGAAQSAAPPSLPPCPTTLSTAAGPFIGLLIGGECINLSGAVRRADTPSPVWNAQLDQVFGATRVQLTATFDADPFVTFGITTTNLVAGPVSYTFVFGTPIVPGVYTTASSSGGVTVTPGTAQNATVATGAVFPSFISGYGTVGSAPTNLGVNLGTTPCTATTATATCNYGTANNDFAPTFYDNLEAMVAYTQTDIGSVASWSGRVDLLATSTTIPEPTTVALLATGLAALAGVARRCGPARRRRA